MIANKIRNLFQDLEHQPMAINLLVASLINERIAPAYLFSGPKGVGQKAFAIRFFEGLIKNSFKEKETRLRLSKLNHPDLLWVEPTYINEGKLIDRSNANQQGFKSKVPPQIRLEQIRSLRRFLSKKPVESKIGMIVLEDVENMNESASNALLKTLEEPINGILILISSRKDMLLSTIKSRCQEIPFKGLSSFTMKSEFLSKHSNMHVKQYGQSLLNLSNGSPDVLNENITYLENIPRKILEETENMPNNYLEALSTASVITEDLSTEQQLWLINLLQEQFWEKERSIFITRRFEKLRNQLLNSVQPRIAWEIALIELTKFH